MTKEFFYKPSYFIVCGEDENKNIKNNTAVCLQKDR